MKRKWLIAVSFVLLLVVAAAVAALVSKKDAPAPTLSVADNCWEHVTNYTVTERDDGAFSVSLTAPDYVKIISLLKTGNVEAVTEETIAETIKNNPDATKDYSFEAPSSAEADVKAALIEQISFELLYLTLPDMNG